MNQRWTSPEGFETLVREHQGMVFRTLVRLTGPGTHAEDLAQEVFLRLYRALPDFRGDAMISTYLYRIVVNVAQDEWKRRRREREHIAPEPLAFDEDEPGAWLENQPASNGNGAHTHTPEQILSDAETQDAVQGCLQSLPEHERAVLVLYHGEELSYEGISAALGMPDQHRPHPPAPRTQASRRTCSRPNPAQHASNKQRHAGPCKRMDLMDPHRIPNRAPNSSGSGTPQFEAAVVRALEQTPAVTVPSDFAARIAALAATQPQPKRAPRLRFGPMMTLVATVVVAAALFAFPGHTTPSLADLRFDLELLLFVELGLSGYLLSRVGLRD